MPSLVYPPGKLCGWCLTQPATTTLYGTPTCLGCAGSTGKQRCQLWLRACYRRRQQGIREQA